MRIFSVCGITQSGKTTTIEHIIRELASRGYKVGSVKNIFMETFTIDPNPNTNTNRHKAAGSTLVTARGRFDTSVIFPSKLPMKQILDFYAKDYDWVVLEGVDDIAVPTIVTAHALEDLEQKWSPMAFALSGRLGAVLDEYMGKPAIDATTQIQKLVDLIELKVFKRLPDFPPECCGACGTDCNGLAAAIIAGKAKRADCVADCGNQGIELSIDGEQIMMVPFVQALLRNALLGVVSELEGYKKGASIDVRMSGKTVQIQEK
jgi:molybdopterin-guanine dinucleotide biosynthesis protein B